MTTQTTNSTLAAFPDAAVIGTDQPKWKSATGRVLHLINGEHYSGAERVQDLLAMRLPECGFQVGLACVKPDLFPKMRNATAAPLYASSMRSRSDLAAIRTLRDIIVRDEYDILHAHTPRTVMLGSLLSRWTGKPLVYHVHSPVGRDSTRKIQNWINGCLLYTSPSPRDATLSRMPSSA